MLKKLLSSVAALALSLSPVLAQTYPPPQVSSVGAYDLFQDIVNGVASAANQYVSAGTLLGSVGIGFQNNFLIGGKADDNLWQVGTTGASVTTTLTYGGPDMWVYWSGTNTAMTVTKSNTAAALPVGSSNVFRMQRTASQTGVIQMCMAQEVSTKNSIPLQGKTAEVDFNVYTGANFSGTGLTAYIISGTVADEGTVNLAFGLNAAGGGSSGWTGQANATAAVIPLPAVSTAYRVAAIGLIPTAALEVAVALCYTPVGTAGTTDALYFDNIELREKGMLAAFVNTTAGYVINANSQISVPNTSLTAVIPSYYRRLAETESADQYAYYYRINEGGTAGLNQGYGYYDTTTHCSINFTFPQPMYKTPVIDETTSSITTSTWKIAPTSVTPVALAGTSSSGAILQVGSTAAAPFTMGTISFITTAETQWIACGLDAANGAGWFAFNSRL